jgi:hypothetical protein
MFWRCRRWLCGGGRCGQWPLTLEGGKRGVMVAGWGMYKMPHLISFAMLV